MKLKQLILLAVMVWSLTLAQGGQAETITVATYVDLSIARLEQVKAALEQENRALTEFEEYQLLQQYGITAEEYVTYRSAHHEEVDNYLAMHPELSEQIDRLSAGIRTLIEQGETP